MATVSASEIQSSGSSKNPKLKAISDVNIEKNGKFKYILLKVHDPAKEREFKHIVRGSSKAEYHGMYNIETFLCRPLLARQILRDYIFFVGRLSLCYTFICHILFCRIFK